MTPTPTPRTDERANSWESIDGQWVNAEFARQLERELASARAWSSKLADFADDARADTAAERALADRLAVAIEQVLPAFGTGGDLSKAWAAWKEARSEQA